MVGKSNLYSPSNSPNSGVSGSSGLLISVFVGPASELF